MTFGVLALICGLELAMIVTVVLLDWRANRPNLPVATLRRRVR